MSRHSPERILAELRRRSTLPKDVPERAYLIGIRWLLAEAADALEAALSVAAEEPEWEYGVKATGDSEPFTDHYDSLDAMSEEFDGRTVWNVDEEVVRRRKAGPWVPLEQKGVV